MPHVSHKDGFENTDLELFPQPKLPQIEEVIGQTVARMLGFDLNDKIWRSLRVDNDGKLVVTNDYGDEYIPVYTTTSFGNGAALKLLSKNSKRLWFTIQNTGIYDIIIAPISTSGFAGILLSPGGFIKMEKWNTEVWVYGYNDVGNSTVIYGECGL